jgi:hypothetical protein
LYLIGTFSCNDRVNKKTPGEKEVKNPGRNPKRRRAYEEKNKTKKV